MIKRTTKNLSNVVLSEEAFTYDAAGNITDAPDTCFAYDVNNRLTTFNGNDVSYDLDGNMLSNGSLSFTYDSANRLVSAGGHTYTYNAEDVRIRNLCCDADTAYVYDTNSKLSKLLCKTTNGITTKYVYGKGLIGEEKCGNFKTYHFDCRGSTIAITDICGNITDTFEYDTYGKLISRTGSSFVIFGYNGRDGVVTDKNGLIYMRARYYSPDMKRFVNADIVAGEISNAVTLNRFAYANGNPVSFIDPFGLRAMSMASHAMTRDGGGGTTSEKDYIYSDDPYWEALLTQNDAIYVADYDELKQFAHAYVYLKDRNGTEYSSDDIWYKTEFNAGEGDNIIQRKYSAFISCNPSSNEDIIKDLSRPFVTQTVKNKHRILWFWEYTTSYTYGSSGVQYVPIKGDFSDSLQKAKDNINSDFGGYDLITNNCLHYVKEILKKGNADSDIVEYLLTNSLEIVPALFYDSLYSANQGISFRPIPAEDYND